MRMRHRGWHLQVQLQLDAAGDAQLEALARDCDAAIVVCRPAAADRCAGGGCAGPAALGTDWPHTEIAGELPRGEDLVDLLATWLPDPLLRQQVCVDNPARLYDFASGNLT